MAAQRRRAVPEERDKGTRGKRDGSSERAKPEEPGNMYLMQLRHFINSHLFPLRRSSARERETKARARLLLRTKKWALFVESERTFRKDSP